MAKDPSKKNISVQSVRLVDYNKPSSSEPEMPVMKENLVRRRCGFGCVICGLPIYHFDVLDKSSGKRHRNECESDELTLLCDKHFKERKAGILSEETIAAANKKPYNLQSKNSFCFEYSGNDGIEVILCGHSLKLNKGWRGNSCSLVIPLQIDQRSSLSFSIFDNHILCDIFLLDKYNRQLVSIHNNAVFENDPYDDAINFHTENNSFVIQYDKDKTLLEMELEQPNRLLIKSGNFLMNGIKVVIDQNRVLVNDKEYELQTSPRMQTSTGITIGGFAEQKHSLLDIEKINRYK